MTSTPGERVPAALRPAYEAVTAQTDAICAEHLTAEYAALARRMAAALARKRPSPLAGGKPTSWAAGILYALGRSNFLFDRSQTPYLRAEELCRACGVSQATGSKWAHTIEEALHINWLDWHWSLRSRLARHPTAWMIQVDGLIQDARYVPLDIQLEAYEKGYIPWVPALGPEDTAAVTEPTNHGGTP